MQTVQKKDAKRASAGWQLPHATLLALEISDVSLRELQVFVAQAGLEDDVAGTGFEEIWLMFLDTIPVFGRAELLGIFPSSRWGSTVSVGIGEKPYG